MPAALPTGTTALLLGGFCGADRLTLKGLLLLYVLLCAEAPTLNPRSTIAAANENFMSLNPRLQILSDTQILSYTRFDARPVPFYAYLF